MEESLKAESQLRGEAEASIQLYKELLERMRQDHSAVAANAAERNARIKEYVNALTTMISDKNTSTETMENALQLLVALSREVEHS